METQKPISSVQSLSRVRLCDPMNRSMPGLPVHHKLLEFTQTHAHRVGYAIQPSHRGGEFINMIPLLLLDLKFSGKIKWDLARKPVQRDKTSAS